MNKREAFIARMSAVPAGNQHNWNVYLDGNLLFCVGAESEERAIVTAIEELNERAAFDRFNENAGYPD